MPMTQLQPMSTLSRFWCGVLVFSCMGCQAYSPYGYGGGYSGNYPVYQQPGQAMPYGGQPGTLMPTPNPGYPSAYPGTTISPGPYGTPGGINPYTSGSVTPPTQGADGSGDSFGQPGVFPGTTTPPTPNVPTNRPSLPPDSEDYLNGPTGPAAGGGTPTTQRPPANSGGPSNFHKDQGGPQKATQNLKRQSDTMPGVPDSTMVQPRASDGSFASLADGNMNPGTPSGIVQTSQHIEAAQPARDLRPYGRAPNGRAWFRGVVDFDEQENSWYLIYNPEPDATDPQGGLITLVDHPHLKLFQPDDVVLVEGHFDPSESDRAGNSKYRPEIVRRLVP